MSATKDIANSHPGSSQSQPSRRKEIYRYTAPEPLFASAWSNKLYPDKRFRMSVCTILTEEKIDNNTLFVIELDEGVGELVARCVQKHAYPASAMRFIPNADPQASELLATASDHLRIYRYEPEKPSLSEECNLYSNKSQAYCSPLTNLDWNVVDPSMVGTTSFDTTATIWNIEVGVPVGQVPARRPTVTGNVRTQLIAHEKPVHAIAFTPIGNGRDHFGTAGADGSVRLFDLRSLQHSTILHEDPEKRALNHLAWNRLDATKLATVAHESNEVVVLDVRMPCRPIAKFRGHRDSINGIAWAPHSEVHLCTAGSDHQALIWQMNHFNDEPILAYNAEGEINQIHWASNLNQWISICFDNNLETLRAFEYHCHSSFIHLQGSVKFAVMNRDESLLYLKHLKGQDATLLVCGSMNPIHDYHLEAIRTSRRHLESVCGCRSVRAIISPVADAYEKSDLESAEHRLQMAKLAVEDNNLADWVEVDNYECGRQGWTPTLRVLNYHRERLKGERRLILLVGSDIANSFVKLKPSGQPLWNPIDVREIIANYGIIVIRRLGHRISTEAMAWLEKSPSFEVNVAVVEMPTAVKLLSSSDIRERLRSGLSVDGFTSGRVADYIKEHHLYSG